MDYKVIKKGKLASPKIDGFVSLTHFLIVKEDGRKFLLLKLSNDRDEKLAGLKLEICQKNAKGAEICTFTSDFDVSAARPLSPFVLDKKIELSDACCDCGIKIVSADFGNYTYSAGGDTLVLDYKKTDDKNLNRAVATTRPQMPEGINHHTTVKRSKIWILACLIMLVALSAATVFTYFQLKDFTASASTFFHLGVEYAFEKENKSADSNVYVIGCKSDLRDIEIPEKIRGHKVTYISASAFSSNTRIESVAIYGDIEIRDWAFYSCHNLRSVKLKKVSVIGDSAFRYCLSLEEIDAGNLSSIGVFAFNGCNNLTRVKIENSGKVLKIGNKAFASCGNLSTVDINQFIDYSGNIDFFNLSDNIFKLRLKNYNYSFSLNGRHYSDTNVKTIFSLFGYDYLDGRNYLYSLNELTIDNCDVIPARFCYGVQLYSVTINKLNVAEAGNYAFWDCRNLRIFNVPRLSFVGEYSFYNTAISDFDGTSLNYIGNYAFANCHSLVQFDLRNNVMLDKIGVGAFSYCFMLRRFFIPEAVSDIPEKMFVECGQLGEVTTGGKILNIGDSAFEGCGSLNSVPLRYAETIGSLAFSGCVSLVDLNLSQNQSLITIGSEAFLNCSGITLINLPDTTKEIGLGAFEGCWELKSLTVPFIGGSKDNNRFLSYIFGSRQYYDPYAVPETLEKITVKSMTTVADYAFYNCRYIKEVVFESKITSIGNYAFYSCKKLNNFIIPASVASIGTSAFENCYKLYEIYNLSSLKIARGDAGFGMAGYYALKVYGALNDIKIAKTSYNGYDFGRADSGEWYLINYTGAQTALVLPQNIYYLGERIKTYKIIKFLFTENWSLDSVSITGDVDGIGEYSFSNSSVRKITVSGNNLSSIDFGAFSDSYSLEEITLPFIGGSRNADNEDGYLSYIFGGRDYYSGGLPYQLRTVTLTEGTRIPKNAFYYCSWINTINLPSTIRVIEEYAFYYCSALTTINLPSSLDTIGINAFSNCNRLETVKLGGTNVTRISERAFTRCLSLSQIELPSKLETIDREAFIGCHRLYTIKIPESVTAIDEYAFLDCFSLCDVINLSGLFIQKGAAGYGYVAYYALQVNTSPVAVALDMVVADGFRFMRYAGQWYLISMPMYEYDITLPSSFTFKQTAFSSYILRESAFANNSYGDVYIPASVSEIQKWQLYYSVSRVYYKGTEQKWNSLMAGNPDSPLANCEIYFV